MIPIYIITAAIILYMVTLFIRVINKAKPWASSLSWFEGLFIGIIFGVTAMYFVSW